MTSPLLGVGVWPGADLPAPEVIGLVQAAETIGLHSVWFSEAYYGRDAITLAAATAIVTERITIATGVVNPFTRHPALLAMTMATLAELAPGRVILGVGTGEPHWLEAMGYDFSTPRTAVAEAIDLYKRLLAREAVSYRGKTVTLENARLMFRPSTEPPPVILAAVGPKMCELAREEASGVLLSVGGPKLAEVVRGRLGDVGSEFVVAMTIPLAVDDDKCAALLRIRPTVTGLIAVPEGEAILGMSGFDPGLAQQLREVIDKDGFKSGMNFLPDEIVSVLAIAGTPKECIGRVSDYLDAGVNLPVLLVGKHNRQETLSVLDQIQRCAIG